MDSLLNRISSISDTTGTPVTLASYTYLGLNTVIQITYPQPTDHVQLDLWGGTTGVFSGFDNFNRIIDQRWQNNVTTTPSDIDRYQYGYDLNSNRVWKANPLTSGMDELYAYDALNRLTSMQRGSLTGDKTAISGTPAAEQDWTLDITGNWKEFKTIDSGTTTLDQTRTANTVNEITTNTYWAATEYDAAGNTTNFPNPASLSSAYTGVYDAWNRLVSVSNGGTPVGQYQYDGANRRIVKISSPGGTSETRHFYYTASNQDIEERVGSATTMDKQFVWGIRYIDELVCRDSAATPTRLYATQDANFNVTSLLDASSGDVDQRFQYDPYGTATVLTSTWTGTTDGYKWTRMFTGQFLDPETLIYYYRARYYHPDLGRFLGRDSIGYVDGPNLYQYVQSNPVVKFDPSGNGPSWQACFDYWKDKWLEDLKKTTGQAWVDKVTEALKDCVTDTLKDAMNSKDAPKKKEVIEKFIKCLLSKVPGLTGISDLLENTICCVAASGNFVDPVNKVTKSPDDCFGDAPSACQFQNCHDLFDPGTWSWKGALNAGDAYNDCLCDCPQYFEK